MSGCIWVSSLLLLLLLSSPSLPAMIAISPKWSIMERQIDKKNSGCAEKEGRKEGRKERRRKKATARSDPRTEWS